MKFDREWLESLPNKQVPQLLRQKHPHLSNAQHRDRIYTAVHEAAHLVVAGACQGVMGFEAFIRVPGRGPKLPLVRGATGGVWCFAATTEGDALISFAGIAASRMARDPHAEKATVQDQRDFLEFTARLSESQRDELRRQAEAMVRQLAHVIFLIAKALLLYANQQGKIVGRKFAAIANYARELAQRAYVGERCSVWARP